MLLLARLEGKKYGEICGEARNCCEDNNVRISLEADDCLLVLSGAISHVNMPSFYGGCRFLEFKSANDLWPLMFADARVF